MTEARSKDCFLPDTRCANHKKKKNRRRAQYYRGINYGPLHPVLVIFIQNFVEWCSFLAFYHEKSNNTQTHIILHTHTQTDNKLKLVFSKIMFFTFRLLAFTFDLPEKKWSIP